MSESSSQSRLAEVRERYSKDLYIATGSRPPRIEHDIRFVLSQLTCLEQQVETAREALEGLRDDYGSGCWCDGIRGLHDNECKAASKALQGIEEGGDADG